MLRTLGVGLAHGLIAYRSLLKGLSKLEVDESKLRAELDQHWVVLGEAIQTVMRRYGMENPYERLKELTRGQTVDATAMRTFIDSLDALPAEARERLKAMTPADYIGNAAVMAQQI